MRSLVLKTLLSTTPKVEFNDAELKEYEKISSCIGNGEVITLEPLISKQRFLLYLSQHKNYLFHGSNHQHIEVFEPREQTLFNNEITKAVFASSEPMWSIFYAVFDRSKLDWNFRNGCLVYKNRKYHFYSLTEATFKKDPWMEGMLYIIPKDHFIRSDAGEIYFDEWISHDYVKPVAKIKVSVDDFIFIDKIATHHPNESIIKSWLLYKIRARKMKKKKKYGSLT